MKDNGHELTNAFVISVGLPFIAALSFNEGDAAMETIQALENTDLLLLPLPILRLVRLEYPRINNLLIDALSDRFYRYREILRVRGLKPAERYKWLRKTYPDAEQRVQKQYLASFLDMHKVMYSRYKAEYDEQHSDDKEMNNPLQKDAS